MVSHGVQGVGGSNPLAPTNRINERGQLASWPFSFAAEMVRTLLGSRACVFQVQSVGTLSALLSLHLQARKNRSRFVKNNATSSILLRL
jgi:hypothetical protein